MKTSRAHNTVEIAQRKPGKISAGFRFQKCEEIRPTDIDCQGIHLDCLNDFEIEFENVELTVGCRFVGIGWPITIN